MVHHLKGQHVCILLKDGTYYVGKLEDIKEGNLILSARKVEKAQVSGLLGSLFGGLGASGGAGASTALGTSGGLWNTIRIGMGMLQFVWPLMGRFFAK